MVFFSPSAHARGWQLLILRDECVCVSCGHLFLSTCLQDTEEQGRGRGGLQLWNLEFVSVPWKCAQEGRGHFMGCRLLGGINPVSGNAWRERCVHAASWEKSWAVGKLQNPFAHLGKMICDFSGPQFPYLLSGNNSNLCRAQRLL